MKPAILTDLTKCIGCEACVWACKEANGNSRADGGVRLSDATFTAIDHRAGLNIRRQCMHCEDPACVSVCPVGALYKSAAGPVLYDADKCIGCRYCMVGCQFGVPTYEWHSNAPFVRKCTLCYETRLAKGEQPACTAACPTGATKFGDRDALIREAEDRIAKAPGTYIDHIYGVKEAGGTSVLYLSSVPFAELGFRPTEKSDPYPRLTWAVLSKLPNIVSVAAVGLGGIWWICNRRDTMEKVRRGDITLDEAMGKTPTSKEGGHK